MIKINLNGKSRYQLAIDSVKEYKAGIAEAYEKNKKLFMRMAGVRPSEPTPVRKYAGFMGVEGSGFEATQGRGYNDQIKLNRVEGRLVLGMTYSAEKTPMKKLWVQNFLKRKQEEERKKNEVSKEGS